MSWIGQFTAKGCPLCNHRHNLRGIASGVCVLSAGSDVDSLPCQTCCYSASVDIEIRASILDMATVDSISCDSHLISNEGGGGSKHNLNPAVETSRDARIWTYAQLEALANALWTRISATTYRSDT